MAVALLLAAMLAACRPAAELELSDGWVRAMPPGTPMTAAYLRLHWHGDRPLVIASWHSDAHREASLHRTVRRGGVSRMEAAPQARIDPGGSLVLEPGGLHLMLMQPARDLQAGDTVTVTLVSDHGRRFRFDLPVEDR